MKNNKIILSVIVIVLIAAGMWVLNTGKTPEVIRIGGLYPLTGGLASYGEPAYNIAKIAVEDINASGGINGKKLELVAEDHQCDPKIAVSAFEKLSSVNNIHIFTSAACSGTALAIAPMLPSKNALLLGTITSTPKLTNISTLFFRNWASDGQEAKLLAEEALKKGYKNIAVIYEETDYAKGLKIAFEGYMKDSGATISSESFDSKASDVRTQLTKLQSHKPDLVFVSVQTVTTGEMVLTQMEQLKIKPTALFINDNILKAGSLLKNHATLLEGAIGGDYVFPVSEKLQVVLAKYKAHYGVDCPQINICAAEYDAIQVLAKAIKEKGDSAEGVRDYLKTVNYEGTSGEVSFDSSNDRSNALYSLFVIKEGKAELLK